MHRVVHQCFFFKRGYYKISRMPNRTPVVGILRNVVCLTDKPGTNFGYFGRKASLPLLCSLRLDPPRVPQHYDIIFFMTLHIFENGKNTDNSHELRKPLDLVLTNMLLTADLVHANNFGYSLFLEFWCEFQPNRLNDTCDQMLVLFFCS